MAITLSTPSSPAKSSLSDFSIAKKINSIAITFLTIAPLGQLHHQAQNEKGPSNIQICIRSKGFSVSEFYGLPFDTCCCNFPSFYVFLHDPCGAEIAAEDFCAAGINGCSLH